MKVIAIILAIIAYTTARPSFLTATPTFLTTAPVVPIQSQFHAQDALGQYSYGYSGGLSAKSETKTFDGITRGSYTYIDTDGKLQSVEYTADALNGFRAAATNLPKSPIDDNIAPQPVRDTPEVAQARADHLAAFKEAEIRAAAHPEEPEQEKSDDTMQTDLIDNNQSSNGNIEHRDSNIDGDLTHISTSIAATSGSFGAIQATPSLALRSLETPATSYSYHIGAPSYGYSIASSPAIYTYAPSTPLLSRSHAIRFDGLNGLSGFDGINRGDLISADRAREIIKEHGGHTDISSY